MKLNYYQKEKYQRLKLAITIILNSIFLICFAFPIIVYNTITLIYWVLVNFKEESQSLNTDFTITPKVTPKATSKVTDIPIIDTPIIPKEKPIYILYLHRTQYINYDNYDTLSMNSFLEDTGSEKLIKDRLATFENKCPSSIKNVIEEGLNLESVSMQRCAETTLQFKLLANKITKEEKDELFFNFIKNNSEIVLNNNFNLTEIDICVNALINTGHYKIKKPFSWFYLTLEVNYLCI